MALGLARALATALATGRAVIPVMALAVLLAVGSGCARTSGEGSRAPGEGGSTDAAAAQAFAAGASEPEPALDPQAVLAQAEAALAGNEPARAVALFGRALVGTAGGTAAGSPPATGRLSPEHAAPAWIGLAQAHEKLRDCTAAIRAYETYLQRYPDGEHVVLARARRGACEAELERWEESAVTFHAIAELPEQIPSVQVEALAREGYALFMLDRMDEADARLAAADAVYEQAVEQQTERFSNTYFVGMARFYRAAILHRRFREVEIRLPEKVMEAAFTAKLELLVKAQDAYNHTISAKHMFWVSAAGYQLGHLFSELYDALMYAPVPEWLDARQREVYFEELKKQLRPVVTKAVWVFEKNLETARRLGYESEFIERTETKLGHLQAVMLSDEITLGQPHPHLTREGTGAIDASGGGSEGRAADARGSEGGSASDRKLFVPRPTPL